MERLDTFITNTYNEVVTPIFWVLISVAFIVFFWGVVELIRSADNEEARATGRQHMLWGIIGIFIMVSVFGITRILIDTIGVEDDVPILQQQREGRSAP